MLNIVNTNFPCDTVNCFNYLKKKKKENFGN